MKEQILKLREEGKTYTEIQKELGCSKSTISYHCSLGQKEKVKQRKLRLKTKGKISKEKRVCLQCNSTIKSSTGKYCGIKCYQEHKFLTETLVKFKEGRLYWSSTIRKVLIRLFGNKCSKCSQQSEWKGAPLTLEVDHIDGNSDNCSPNNLRLLCPNCHSQTPTSNGKNLKKETKRNKYLRKYKK